MECVSCKTDSILTIRNINFCNACFTRKIYKKVRQELNKINEPNVLFIFSGDKNSCVLMNILSEMIHNNSKIKIKVINVSQNTNFQFSKNKFEIYNHSIDSNENEIKNFFNNIKIQYNSEAIMTSESLDDLTSKALVLVIQGKGREAVDYVSQKNTKIYRPLININKSEIEIFFDLNRDQFPEKIIQHKNDFLSQETEKFVDMLNEKNYSTSYNVIETLKKL
ncbi:hypothetical protein GVAV_002302 [Gurleya vavrai]